MKALFVILLGAGVVDGLSSRAQAQFVGLGMLPGATSSRAVDISLDGTTIIGNTFVGSNLGVTWRWTSDNGVEALGFPSDSRITSISDDGSAITAVSASGGAYLWRAGVVQQLPLVSSAVVSGDGQVVFGQIHVGSGLRGANQAAKWASAAGVTQLPDGPHRGGGDCSWYYTPLPITPVAANEDGTLATGTTTEFASWGCAGEVDFHWNSTPNSSFMWGQTTGTVIRMPLVYDMSSDGSVLLVAGTPLRWIDGDNPPVPLVGLNANNGASPMLSGDGQAAVAGNLIWEWVHGTRTLQAAFSFYGLDTTGWSNFVATGLAYHGTVLCGYATNPSGATEAWFADLGGVCQSADFNHDGDIGTDADIEAFFACLGGNCCATCGNPDFNNDGDIGTDADIEAFFRVLAGGTC